MSEGRRYCHALSFAHCVRMNNLGSGNSDVQSSWSVLTSCHMRSIWTGCWGSGACPSLCSQPLESSVCRQDSASLEEECQVRVCETQDRAEPRSVTASMWCGVFMCSHRRSWVWCFLHGVLSCVCVCVWLLTQCSFIFNLISCLYSQSGTMRKINSFHFETSGAKWYFYLQIWFWEVKVVKGWGYSNFGKFWIQDMSLLFFLFVYI